MQSNLILGFKLGDEIGVEIKSAFCKENRQSSTDLIKDKLKNHKKKLMFKYLNLKWDISLESYVEHRMIMRGLREKVVPSEHLHTEHFLEKWSAACLKRGLDVMCLIIEEEKLQLQEINKQIEKSVAQLDPFIEEL